MLTLGPQPGPVWSIPVSDCANRVSRRNGLSRHSYWGSLSTAMLYEPTTLANVARLIGETLQKDYGIDPGPLFEQVKIDTSVFQRPGAQFQPC